MYRSAPRAAERLVISVVEIGYVRRSEISKYRYLIAPADAEHQLQVLSDARSHAALQLLGYASAAQRAAGVSGLVPHAFLRLLRPEDCLAVAEGDAHARRRAVAGRRATSDRNRRALFRNCCAVFQDCPSNVGPPWLVTQDLTCELISSDHEVIAGCPAYSVSHRGWHTH